MRITFSKLAFDLNPILLRPVLGLALVAAFAPACGGGSTTGTPGTAGTSGGTAGTTGTAGHHGNGRNERLRRHHRRGRKLERRQLGRG